jgi:uncharacterized protein
MEDLPAAGLTPGAGASTGLERLLACLRPLGRVAVLLSGGVDSALVAAAAARALGQPSVLALTFASQLTPDEDLTAARALASRLSLRHVVLPLDALALPEVANNAPSRCYACKREVLRLAAEAAGAQGFTALAEGSNAGDMESDRPGLRALAEARESGGLPVRSPLAEAGLTKPAVRALARTLSLPVWDRPSSPCLATRFPTGHRLSRPEIKRVQEAERGLRGLGLRVLRLRQGPSGARLEVAPAELEQARRLWPKIIACLAPLGLALAAPPLPYSGPA